MPYMLLHCNNKLCKYNNIDKMLCGATDVHYVDRLCLTFKRRPDDINYKELMRVDNPNCHKSGGKYKSSRIELLT